MGLIQKKDERDVIDGIEVIGRGEGPDGLEEVAYDLVEGQTAEDISGTTAAKDADAETEPDPELMGEADEDVDAAEAEGEDAAAEGDGAAEEDADVEDALADDASDGGSGEKLAPNHGKLFAAISVIAVIVAAIGGYFFGSGGFAPKGVGSTTLAEDQLDATVATWTYNGAKKNVTAREAIESQYSLDTVKNTDGTYPTPSADVVMNHVRTQIILADAESRGITVSDDELDEYAQSGIGTSDWDTIAKQYGVAKDQAKDIVRQQCTIQKLYSQIVPETAATAPQEPTAPKDGKSETASKDYADYIIGLAGDEWDADKGTWAKEGGTIQSALKDEKFTADSATYAQAQKAYAAAYQAYAQASSSASETWKDYENGLFQKADISLYGLYV